MNKISNVAKQEVGEKEYPEHSNKTKYGEWFGWNGVMWCGIFVSWVYNKAGFPLGNIGFKKGFAGCLTAVKHFEEKGEITDNPSEGDIVFYDWNGDKRYDHTGIFIQWLDDKHTKFKAIEGNTSLNNQSNGGEVMERIRKNRNVIFVHPKILEKC